MGTRIELHPETPHHKRVFDIVDQIRAGGIVLLPTESQYSIACHYNNKKGIDRIRSIRELDKNHTFTLLINDLTAISRFAHLSDANFKLIKRLIPGPVTFILPATKEVPKLLLHPRRKTIGFRVPEYPICEAILTELDAPMLAVSARSSQEVNASVGVFEHEELFETYGNLVDIYIDNNEKLNADQTTVLDLTEDVPEIIRSGLGIDKTREVLLFLGYKIDEEF